MREFSVCVVPVPLNAVVGFSSCILHAGGFPKSVCTSINECMCHGIPDSRPLRDGDIVNVDVTVYLNVRRLVQCTQTFMLRRLL